MCKVHLHRTSSASPGQLPPAGERGAGSVPELHNSPVRDSRALGRIMAHDAFHAYSHGTSGARVLACLDPLEGASVPALAGATGLHRTTVRRRLLELLGDHLVEEADDLYYLPLRTRTLRRVLDATVEAALRPGRIS